MTCDLGLVLEITGGFGATCLAYIFRELLKVCIAKARAPADNSVTV
jgi:hypothetical protein